MTATAKRNLEQMAKDARELANELFSTEEARCVEQKTSADQSFVSCIQKENDRKLTGTEIEENGWARRPFYAYDPERMCSGCRAFYYTELAAQELHRMRCDQVRHEAVVKAQTARAGSAS